MRYAKVIRAAALGGALMLSGLLGGGTAAGAGPPSLGAVTKLSGVRSGYVRVTVDKAFTMNWTDEAIGDAATATVSSPAIVSGVALLRDGATTVDTWNGFVVYRVNARAVCHEPGCAPDVLQASVLGPTAPAREFTVPAGTYRLYLFGDGPITGELRIPGAMGTTQLAVTNPVAAKSRELPRRDPAGADNIAVFGASDSLASKGVLVSFVGTLAQVESNSNREACVQEGGIDGQPLAFYPFVFCTDGGASTGQAPVGRIGFQVAFTQTSDPGVNSIGGNVTAGAVLKGVGAAGLWLSFDK